MTQENSDQSYVRGERETPLIEIPIGAVFRRGLPRARQRRGAGVAPPEYPPDLCRTAAEGRRPRLFADPAWPRQGRAHRHLVAEQRRVDADPIRHGQGRPDPRQHQSGLSPVRTRLCDQQGGLQGDHTVAVLQEQRLPQDARANWRRKFPMWPRASWNRCACPRCAMSSASARKRRRACRISTISWLPPSQGELDALQELGASLTAREPINIQFTSGTTGAPKGATLTHRNILNNGRFVGDAIRLQAGERLCIPVPLYHCFGMVMANLGCPDPWRDHRLSGRVLRSAVRAAGGRGRALRRALRRAHHVHRRARSSGLRQIRPVQPAHRHHGRQPVPDRSDEARHRQAAHARRHHRLWHDGNLAGLVPERHATIPSSAASPPSDACSRIAR